jgi:hypothetical protein
MKRKDTFVAIAIAIILVLSISPIHIYGDDELINPYKNWIESKDLKNCSMTLAINGITKFSSLDEESLIDERSVSGEFFFENGEFDNSSNTFNALNITNVTWVWGETYEIVSKQEFQVTFDSGLNNIESFSLSSIITRNSTDPGESTESKFLIEGSGASFPFLKEISEYSDTESGFVEIVDTKNTSYFLCGPEKMGKCVKEVANSIISTCKVKDKYKTSKYELIEFKFDESSYLEIRFEGYLPRLRDNEGTCSYFGGPNDTGIDVTLRKKFYEEHVGEYTPANFTYEEFYKNKKVREEFDKWMNDRAEVTLRKKFYEEHVGEYTPANFTYEEFYKNKKVREEFDKWMNDRAVSFVSYEEAGWEGTGLHCGPARNLDTENDYYCAMRWHNRTTEKYGDKGKPGHQHWWREQKIKVTNPATGNSTIVRPVDWGPNVTTNRVIDLSEKAMEEIGATTDVTWVEMCIVDSDTPLGLVTNQQDNKKMKKL